MQKILSKTYHIMQVQNEFSNPKAAEICLITMQPYSSMNPVSLVHLASQKTYCFKVNGKLRTGQC
jgi:hypothetical protein